MLVVESMTAARHKARRRGKSAAYTDIYTYPMVKEIDFIHLPEDVNAFCACSFKMANAMSLRCYLA